MELKTCQMAPGEEDCFDSCAMQVGADKVAITSWSWEVKGRASQSSRFGGLQRFWSSLQSWWRHGCSGWDWWELYPKTSRLGKVVQKGRIAQNYCFPQPCVSVLAPLPEQHLHGKVSMGSSWIKMFVLGFFFSILLCPVYRQLWQYGLLPNISSLHLSKQSVAFT